MKKAYRKATLYVHPDKLQQRGASIHQKYICEKVFDLLKVYVPSFSKYKQNLMCPAADFVCHALCMCFELVELRGGGANVVVG